MWTLLFIIPVPKALQFHGMVLIIDLMDTVIRFSVDCIFTRENLLTRENALLAAVIHRSQNKYKTSIFGYYSSNVKLQVLLLAHFFCIFPSRQPRQTWWLGYSTLLVQHLAIAPLCASCAMTVNTRLLASIVGRLCACAWLSFSYPIHGWLSRHMWHGDCLLVRTDK